jgi:hypothetical protein
LGAARRTAALWEVELEALPVNEIEIVVVYLL